MGVGGVLITLELFGFQLLDRQMKQFAAGLGTPFERIGGLVAVVGAAAKVTGLSTAENFRWNWRDQQELTSAQSLRSARLAANDRAALASAISRQLRRQDFGNSSKEQLRNATLDTRITMIDLNNDRIPEVIAQAVAGCSATGNCSFWIFQKDSSGYQMLLEADAIQTFTIQPTSNNGFRDIVLKMHGSATDSTLTEYQYKGGVYHEVGCYDASWTVLEDNNVRELNEPIITPCSQP